MSLEAAKRPPEAQNADAQASLTGIDRKNRRRNAESLEKNSLAPSTRKMSGLIRGSLKANADWITTRCATGRAGIGISRRLCWPMPCYLCCERVEKKLPTPKCGSAYPNYAICPPRCYGAGGTALNTCCIGPSGEDDINSTPCAATIESANQLCRTSICNCNTRAFIGADSTNASFTGGETLRSRQQAQTQALQESAPINLHGANDLEEQFLFSVS